MSKRFLEAIELTELRNLTGSLAEGCESAGSLLEAVLQGPIRQGPGLVIGGLISTLVGIVSISSLLRRLWGELDYKVWYSGMWSPP